MLLHDFDGDGDVDLIGASRKPGQSYDSSIAWIPATLSVYANLGRARSATAAPFFEAVTDNANPFVNISANVRNYNAASVGSTTEGQAELRTELTFTFFDIDNSGFDDLIMLGDMQHETDPALVSELNPTGSRYWRTLEVYLNNGLAAPSRRYVKVEGQDAAYQRWGFADIYTKEEFPTGAFTFYDVDSNGMADLVWGRGDGSFDTYLNTGTRAGSQVSNSWSTVALSESSTYNAFSTIGGGGGAGGIFADVNGDGHDDFVTTTQHTRDGSGGAQARLFLNDGTGKFPKESIGRSNPFYDVYDGLSVRMAFADMDGDGEADVVASAGGDGAVFVIFARWAGRFGTDIAGRGAFNPLDTVSFTRDSFSAPAVGDVNGDGYNDIITSAGKGLALLLGGSTASGASSNYTFVDSSTFASLAPLGRSWSQEAGNAAGVYSHQRPFLFDTDGDGDLDLVLTGPVAGSLTAPCSVKLFLNDGSGAFTVASTNPFAAIDPECKRTLYGGSDAQFGHSVLHDMTGDGHVDLVVAVANGIKVFPNDEPPFGFSGTQLSDNLNPLYGISALGTFSSSSSDIGITFHDVSGDGNDDLIVAQSSFNAERGRNSLNVHALFYANGTNTDGADLTFYGKPTYSRTPPGGYQAGSSVDTGTCACAGVFFLRALPFRAAIGSSRIAQLSPPRIFRLRHYLRTALTLLSAACACHPLYFATRRSFFSDPILPKKAMLISTLFNDLEGLSVTAPIPAFADVNGDGVLDLILGGKDGRLRVWPRGMCPMVESASHGTLCTTAQAGTCAAARGDRGGQVCACNTGYTGFRCGACAPGYDRYADGTCGIPLCAAGKYVAQTGGCKFCEEGKFSNIASTSIKCTDCGLGNVAPDGESTVCE